MFVFSYPMELVDRYNIHHNEIELNTSETNIFIINNIGRRLYSSSYPRYNMNRKLEIFLESLNSNEIKYTNKVENIKIYKTDKYIAFKYKTSNFTYFNIFPDNVYYNIIKDGVNILTTKKTTYHYLNCVKLPLLIDQIG